MSLDINLLLPLHSCFSGLHTQRGVYTTGCQIFKSANSDFPEYPALKWQIRLLSLHVTSQPQSHEPLHYNKSLYVSISQFSSVAQSCPTLCDPLNRSMPGLPVHHQLPEFTQTHIHRVGDAIQPSHPLLLLPQSLPASGSFPMSQLFAWGCQKYWSVYISINIRYYMLSCVIYKIIC